MTRDEYERQERARTLALGRADADTSRADLLISSAANSRSADLANQAADLLEGHGHRNLASVVRSYAKDRGWSSTLDTDTPPE